MKRATLLDRYSAYFIDGIFFTVIYIFLYGIALYLSKSPFLGYIILIIFWLLFLAKDMTGKSPGKMLMKIKVVKKDDYSKPNIFISFVRNFLLAFAIIEIPVMLFDPKNERLGDKITGTIVIKEEN